MVSVSRNLWRQECRAAGFRSQAFERPFGEARRADDRVQPEHFDALQTVAKCIGAHCNLGHRPFVDYYYASSDWCSCS